MKKHILKGLMGLGTMFLFPMVVVLVGCFAFAVYQLFLGIPVAQSIQDFKQLMIAYQPYLSLTTKWIILTSILGLLLRQRGRIREALLPFFRGR